MESDTQREKIGAMRKSGAWMTIWDDRILEIALKEDAVNASDLAKTEYFDVSRAQISNRLNVLADHGLLIRLGNGVYQITERGEDYLNGELDAREGYPDYPAEIDNSGENGGRTSEST